MANVMLLGTAEAAAPTTVAGSQPFGLQLHGYSTKDLADDEVEHDVAQQD